MAEFIVSAFKATMAGVMVGALTMLPVVVIIQITRAVLVPLTAYFFGCVTAWLYGAWIVAGAAHLGIKLTPADLPTIAAFLAWAASFWASVTSVPTKEGV